MKKSVLESDIKKIDQQLKNQQLPANVRSALESARKKAQKQLEDGAFDKEVAAAPKTPANKSTGKKTSAEEDCEEILSRYRKQKKVKKERVEKRERAGKPKDLTVTETIDKAAKSVGKKVQKKEDQDKPITKKESQAAINQAVELVKKLVEGMGTPREKRRFINHLIESITHEFHEVGEKDTFVQFMEKKGYKRWYLSNHPIARRDEAGSKRINNSTYEALEREWKEGTALKAEKGLHVKGKQMHIFHYHTQHFDISPEAQKYFQRILNEEPVAEKHKALIVAMARDVDDLLGKVKTTKLTDETDKESFIYAAGKAMRAMYWSYGIIMAIDGADADPHSRYPSFLAQDLYVVANHTRKEPSPKIMGRGGLSGRHPGLHWEEGDEVVEQLSEIELDQVNDSLSNDENSSDEEIVDFWTAEGIDKEVAIHIVKKYRPKFRTDPLFQLEQKDEDDVKKPIKKERGGKVKFKGKVDAISKELEGKPVPKQYQKTEGKRFTKKTAKDAARRIAGSMERKGKGGRKMLLGGVALHTPANISLLGDQNNLDIHSN